MHSVVEFKAADLYDTPGQASPAMLMAGYGGSMQRECV
jgi:hypothetical protein